MDILYLDEEKGIHAVRVFTSLSTRLGSGDCAIEPPFCYFLADKVQGVSMD